MYPQLTLTVVPKQIASLLADARPLPRESEENAYRAYPDAIIIVRPLSGRESLVFGCYAVKDLIENHAIVLTRMLALCDDHLRI
jgi:hypothetical protein